MKRVLLLLFMLSSFTYSWAQENLVTLSGGYAFANFKETESSATGFRINGLYEFVPMGGKISHGISFGYIGTSAERGSGNATTTYELNTWPIYYTLKYTFGKNAFRAFIKGAFGMHYSGFNRIGTTTEIGSFDLGFYGGASAGIVLKLNERFHISGEYEWAYLSNTSLQDGFMNTAMLGIGMMF
jgi:hypothetical protein